MYVAALTPCSWKRHVSSLLRFHSHSAISSPSPPLPPLPLPISSRWYRIKFSWTNLPDAAPPPPPRRRQRGSWWSFSLHVEKLVHFHRTLAHQQHLLLSACAGPQFSPMESVVQSWRFCCLVWKLRWSWVSGKEREREKERAKPRKLRTESRVLQVGNLGKRPVQPRLFTRHQLDGVWLSFAGGIFFFHFPFVLPSKGEAAAAQAAEGVLQLVVGPATSAFGVRAWTNSPNCG